MSSFKQRLGSALQTQLNFASTSSTLSQDKSVYDAGYGSTARKSGLNASKLSNGNNVLSDRVSRISDKINEIHVCYCCMC